MKEIIAASSCPRGQGMPAIDGLSEKNEKRQTVVLQLDEK